MFCAFERLLSLWFKTINTMKKIALWFSALVLVSACKSNTNDSAEKADGQTDSTAVEASTESLENHYFGDTINEEEVVDISKLLAMMEGQDSVKVKLSGVVNSSCQKKGCWMKMDMGNGEEMRVSFRDYGFFVPTNLGGENAIIEGIAYVDTLDVNFLKHLAEDAGKSQEEIDAITEPEISVNFTADGVIIKS